MFKENLAWFPLGTCGEVWRRKFDFNPTILGRHQYDFDMETLSSELVHLKTWWQDVCSTVADCKSDNPLQAYLAIRS